MNLKFYPSPQEGDLLIHKLATTSGLWAVLLSPKLLLCVCCEGLPNTQITQTTVNELESGSFLHSQASQTDSGEIGT